MEHLKTKQSKPKNFLQEDKDYFKHLTEKKGKPVGTAEDAVQKLKKRRNRP